MTVKVGILGANGRMGQALLNAVQANEQAQLAAAMVREGSPLSGLAVSTLLGGDKGEDGLDLSFTGGLAACNAQFDVLIDFTLPDALEANLAWCVANNTAVVIGTTGLNQQQLDCIDKASEQIPVVFAANMSVGVNLLFNLVRQAAKAMGQYADIEIVEAHHRFKQDAPSGTALALGEHIADELGWDLKEQGVFERNGHTGERPENTIGFATMRAGDVVGEHSVWFADIGERIELTHKASSRMTFANGAVRAATWLKGKPSGRYDMQDVLNLK